MVSVRALFVDMRLPCLVTGVRIVLPGGIIPHWPTALAPRAITRAWFERRDRVRVQQLGQLDQVPQVDHLARGGFVQVAHGQSVGALSLETLWRHRALALYLRPVS